jgi:two-component system response regulator MtrA
VPHPADTGYVDHTPPEAGGEAGAVATQDAAMPRRRVLVVDDNELNADYIKAVLKKHPFDVTVAIDGPSAIRAAAAERPDVILLDIMMPGMSGMDVLARFRRDPAVQMIPIIMVTAKAQDSTMLESYQTGADYFITKPFTPRQLLHGLGLVLGVRLLGT